MKKKLTAILALLLLAAMVLVPLAGCAAKKGPEETEEPLTEPGYYINRRPVIFAEEGDTDLDLLTVEKGLKVNVVPFGDETVTVNGEAVDYELAIDCSEIKAGDKIEFAITENGETVTHTVNLYPSTFPAFTTEGESKVPGDFYLGTYDLKTNYVFKLNSKGGLIFYMKTTKLDKDGNEVTANGLDFCKRYNSKGEVRYTYCPYLEDSFANGDCVGINPGCVRVYDKNYDLIDEVYYTCEDGEQIKIDPHGFVWIDDGHYLLAAYKQEIIDVPEDLGVDAQDGKANLAVLYIEEVKDGEVLWEFRSADHDSFLVETPAIRWETSAERCSDYMHYNHMDIDKDGNVLVSCRQQSSILKLSREDGSIIWKLGGMGDEFSLTEDQLFSNQHSIIVTEDGSYMLFDNANATVNSGRAQYSSVERFKVDEEARTVTEYTRYTVVDFFSNFMGAIRELDGEKSVYLWSVGGNIPNDAENPPAWSMVEYTEVDGKAEYNFSFKYDEGMGRLYSSNKCE